MMVQTYSNDTKHDTNTFQNLLHLNVTLDNYS